MNNHVVEIPNEVPQPTAADPAQTTPMLLSTGILEQAVVATPDKRKGPCMARRGQVGKIEISG
jgi:hypothetical protein